MPLPQALLAVLSRGPNHGYELKSLIEGALGPEWGSINVGHFYQVLDRLARDGYITGRQVRQRVRPDRTVFRITPAGRTELDRWLAAPADSSKERRGDVLLKLVAATYLGEVSLRAVISSERHAHLEALHDLGRDRDECLPNSSSWLLVEAAGLDLDTRLRLLDLAEVHAAELVAHAGQHHGDEAGDKNGATRPA